MKKYTMPKDEYNPLKILIDGSIERSYFNEGEKHAIDKGKREIDELEKWLVNKIFSLREKNREYKNGSGIYDEMYIKAFEEILVKVVTGK